MPFGVFLYSLLISASQLWDLTGQIHLSGGYVDISNDSLTRLVCLVVMAACSLGFLTIRSAWGFRVILLIKTGFFALFLIAAAGRPWADLALAVAFLIEIAIYEAFFLNLIWGTLVIASSQLIASAKMVSGAMMGEAGRTWFQTLAIDLFPGLAVNLATLLTASLLVYYREKTINQNERVAKLESVIAKLSATSLGYQHYAEDAAQKSQMEERLRITRELHDIVGYTFTNNIMMMEAAITCIHTEPDRVQKLIDLARQNAQTGQEKIRSTLYLLRSTAPSHLPLRERLVRMVEVFQVATGVQVKMDFGNVPAHFNAEQELFAYFFVQEALTNAFLHGGASMVQARFFLNPSSLCISVADNGRGAESISEGIGLSGMRERLAGLGGSLSFQNIPLGFEIMADFPYCPKDSEVACE